ncbi:MAG: FHA domain-containing protein [Sandaracinaceae bacterium]|nr:hypothetical protein [Myxococcales bacterium]
MTRAHVSELVPLAHQLSAHEFQRRLGGPLLAGPPLEPGVEEEGAATIATTIGVQPGLREPVDLASHEYFVLKKARPALFGRGVTMGRSSKSDVVISSDSISKLHARVRLDKSGLVYVSDLGSSNGTQVNGAFVNPGEEVELQHRDEIILGTRQLRFYDAALLHSVLSKMVPTLS